MPSIWHALDCVGYCHSMNYSNFLLNELYLFISVFEDPTCYNLPAAALFHLYVGSLQHSDILSYNFLKGLNSEADAQANLAVHLAVGEVQEVCE